MGKGLLEKLKLGLATAGLVGFSSFNSANAQSQEKENYIPKYNTSTYKNTTTHYIIKEIQKENAFVSPKTLDDIIDQSKKIITKKNYTEQEAKNLMQKLNSEIIEKYPELNQNKNQSCYFKSLTYLAIGEANNLPLYIVPVPEHLFMRWDLNGQHKYVDTDPGQTAMLALFSGRLPKTFSEEERTEAEKLNKGDFNWDVNSLEFNTDQDYFMKFPFPQEMVDKLWLKNLNKKETLAIAYKQEAVLLKNSEKYQKALEYINKSLALDTSKWEIYAVKGSILSKIGEKECEGRELSEKCANFFLESNKDYEKAIKMANSKDLSPLGKNFYFLKDYQKSEECFNKTLEVFKNDALMRLKRAKFYHLTGQKEKAVDDLLVALNINGEKIVKSGNEFISIQLADDILAVYDLWTAEKKRNMLNRISLRNVVGKEILDWSNSKEICDCLNEEIEKNCKNSMLKDYYSKEYCKTFWRVPSIKELENIYNTYKSIEISDYKNLDHGYKKWNDSKEKRFPEKRGYWSSDEEDKEVFIKSMEDSSIKKINKNPLYWNFEEINSYHNITSMCVKNLDEKEMNERISNFLKNLSWDKNNFYRLWQGDESY
ncbi:MAG: hypothetical protein AABX80_02335 [Nanoarchaeota archaeon]